MGLGEIYTVARWIVILPYSKLICILFVSVGAFV